MCLGATSFAITALNRMTLSKVFCRVFHFYGYSNGHHAQCPNAEYHYTLLLCLVSLCCFVVRLRVLMLSALMLSVFTLSVFKLNVLMLSALMLAVLMLSILSPVS